MNEAGHNSDNMISLAERRAASDHFRTLYDDGMALVEEAAAYLDGEGRAAARALTRRGATLYAAESMRLTTRLMQIASWLLLQRAANSGEMTRDQVAAEKAKVRLDTPSVQEDEGGWRDLPPPFRAIVDQSLRLQSVVRRMDEEIYGGMAAEATESAATMPNPVSDQINLLQTAFARG